SGLVLLLDDLQWAERATVLLFQHLCRKLANDRTVVLVAAFGPLEGLSSPLADCLAELVHERLCSELKLERLDRDETAALVDRLGGNAQWTEAIFEQTLGNPFFVEEVVRQLRDEDAKPESA